MYQSQRPRSLRPGELLALNVLGSLNVWKKLCHGMFLQSDNYFISIGQE